MYKATSVTDYIENHQKWTRELQLLVDLCEETELETTIKWGAL